MCCRFRGVGAAAVVAAVAEKRWWRARQRERGVAGDAGRGRHGVGVECCCGRSGGGIPAGKRCGGPTEGETEGDALKEAEKELGKGRSGEEAWGDEKDMVAIVWWVGWKRMMGW